MAEDEELEEIRRRKLLELLQRLAEDQPEAEVTQRQEIQKESTLRKPLIPEARQPITDLETTRPEFASQFNLELTGQEKEHEKESKYATEKQEEDEAPGENDVFQISNYLRARLEKVEEEVDTETEATSILPKLNERKERLEEDIHREKIAEIEELIGRARQVEGQRLKRSRGSVLLLVGLGITFLICSFFVPFHQFLPAWKHWDGTHTIEQGKREGPSIGLFWGPVVEGMFVISGSNNDIYFSVEDTGGGTVVSRTLASDRYYFGPFNVWKNAYYHFIFDNDMGWFTTKSVYWIVRAYWYNLAFLILGILSSVIGLSIALFGGMKAQEKEGKPIISSVTETRQEVASEIMRKRCPRCGTLNDGIARICDECGAPFVEEKKEASQRTQLAS